MTCIVDQNGNPLTRAGQVARELLRRAIPLSVVDESAFALQREAMAADSRVDQLRASCGVPPKKRTLVFRRYSALSSGA